MVWNFLLPDSIHGYKGGRRRRRRDCSSRPHLHTLHAYVEKAQAVVGVVDDGDDT